MAFHSKREESKQMKSTVLIGLSRHRNGRGRAKDNNWIERFRRTLKMEYVYLNPTSVVNDLRNGIRGFIEYHNHQRHHQGIDGKMP